jgi:ABC-2 type transport system permease protein
MVERLKVELRFMRELMIMNLSSAMEYRVSFISQIVGMFINNGIYFIFWLLFFDAFGGAVQGYEVNDIYLLFAIITVGYGLAFMFAANTGSELAYLIAQGRLDYYLVLPRAVLFHVIFSRMSVSTIGDITFGLVAYVFTGRFHPAEIGLFFAAVVLAGVILAGFSVITGSLAFYIGNAQQLSQQAQNAILTFALYPNSLFSGAARFMLFTLVPAAFVGAIPVEIVRGRSLELLGLLILVAVAIWLLAGLLFYRGLRRYESGSAINVNV